MSELTSRQREALGFIIEFMRENQYPPTVREIGEAMDIGSPNGVVTHLLALEAKGIIEWDRKSARSMRVVGLDYCVFCGAKKTEEANAPD